MIQSQHDLRINKGVVRMAITRPRPIMTPDRTAQTRQPGGFTLACNGVGR
jgi:hypothetical protein